jgi:hypothetical protein
MPSCEWLIDGCPTPTNTSSHPGKVKLSHFYSLDKHRRVDILNHILQDTATKLFKTQKTNQISTHIPFGVEQGLHLLLQFLAKQHITVHEARQSFEMRFQ